MADNGNGNSFTLGFLVGGILGAVVGILIAPKPGVETRAELAERSEVWRYASGSLRPWRSCGSASAPWLSR